MLRSPSSAKSGGKFTSSHPREVAQERDGLGAEAPSLKVVGAPRGHHQPEELPVETKNTAGFA